MSQTDSISVKVQLKSPEKFYSFFSHHVMDLVHLFPEQYKSIQLLETDNFSGANVILFKFILGSRVLTEKYSLRVVEGAKKHIIYEAVEGDVLKLYKVFRVKLEAVNGGLNKVGRGTFAKWTVEFEKANENVASPENYMELAVKVSKGIDAYFTKN